MARGLILPLARGGNTAQGFDFVTIGGSATELGGAGLTFGPTDLTGARVTLTAQLGAGNQATEIFVVLFDDRSDSALFRFPPALTHRR